MELPCLPKHSPDSIAAIRFTASRHAVSTATRSSGAQLSGAGAPETSIGLDSPSGHTGKSPPESCAAPATLMGFGAPTATSARRSTVPGIPTPVRSAFRVSHPLDGLLPPSLPTSRVGATHGVHPTELFPPAEPYAFRRRCPLAVSDIASPCSEDQEVKMPRGFRALLPAEIRARREPKLSPSRCSLGLLRLSRAFPCTPWRRLPVSFPHALLTPLLREKERPALQGLAERASRRTLAG
jgi:hypothetical protein